MTDESGGRAAARTGRRAEATGAWGEEVAAYGPLRAYFRRNPSKCTALRRWLAGADAGTSYDRYLAQGVRRSLAAAGVVALVSVVATGVSALGFVLLGSVAVGVGVAAGHYYWPRLRAARRGRRIDVGHPHAVVFLHALSHGEIDLYDAIERLADAEPVYGPVSGEYTRVVDEMAWFGDDLFTALERVRDQTPSDDLRGFFDELRSVLETGGDVPSFLAERAAENVERAQERQESLRETLGIVAEVYVTGVVAGPGFLLVVLVGASFADPSILDAVEVLTYVGLPLLLASALYGADALVGPYRRHLEARANHHFRRETSAQETGERFERYRRHRRRRRWRRHLTTPVTAVRERPARVFAVSVPAGLLVAGVVVFGGIVTPSLAAVRTEPIVTTAGVVVLPALVAGVPFALLHERRRRRQQAISERVPGVLRVVASGNRNGLELGECLSLATRRVHGAVADELARLDNELQWTDDVSGALQSLARRIDSPDATRALYVLDESARGTSNLAPILDVLGDDLEERNEIRRGRRNEIRPYVVIVGLTVLVFTGILLLFESQFVPALTGTIERSTPGAQTQFRLQTASPARYRRLFYHAALVQAAGNGLLVGKLLDGRVATGVLYATGFVSIVTAAFLAVPP